jgi:hypothetical protein
MLLTFHCRRVMDRIPCPGQRMQYSGDVESCFSLFAQSDLRREKGTKGKRDMHLYHERPLDNYRGDRIRTIDLLNPIFRVKAASSRGMSQMQAFWRLTESTLHTLYADRSRESMICPCFPGLSVPKRAHLEVIGTDGVATTKRHSSGFVGDQAVSTVELAWPCHTSAGVTGQRRSTDAYSNESRQHSRTAWQNTSCMHVPK